MVRLLTRAADMPIGSGGKLDWRGMMKDSGLSVVSLRADLASLEREADRIVREARSFGTDTVVITGMYRFDYGDEKAVRELARRLNQAGETLKDSGLSLLYHDHNVELFQVRPGLRAYDILLADTACRLLLQEDCPGWLHAVKHGATTIWETWDGVRPDGTVHDLLNHYACGAICGWLMGGVCGIRLSAGKLTLAPAPDPVLQYARAEWRSPTGITKSAWEYRDGRLIFDFDAPVPAHIQLPDGTAYDAQAGGYHYEILL